MITQWTVLLCTMAAGCLLHPTEAAEESHSGNNQQPCILPEGYHRFHANDSFIGRPVPCNSDDKICFRYNLIFDPYLDRCEPIGGGRHRGCDLRPNRTEFEHGSGRILGICREYEDPCPGHRMAFDGLCYPEEMVNEVLCGRCAIISRHFLGGVECRNSSTPINVQQPEQGNQCLIPDLRFPDIQRSKFFNNPLRTIQGFEEDRTGVRFHDPTPILRCQEQQAECFANGKVWVSGYEGCHDLLQKGPCPDDHVVAMDSQAAFQGGAEATCVHVRGGCPRGHKRMTYDGQCHEDREIQVGAPGDVVWNQYGQYIFIPHEFYITFQPNVINKSCTIGTTGVAGDRSEYVPKPFCGSDNSGKCQLYEVQANVPKPDRY